MSIVGDLKITYFSVREGLSTLHFPCDHRLPGQYSEKLGVEVKLLKKMLQNFSEKMSDNFKHLPRIEFMDNAFKSDDCK